MTSGGYSYSYDITYGSASSPFKGTVAWNAAGTSVTSVALDGAVAVTATTPAASGTGNDTIAMVFTYANLSVPVTSGSDYPTGTVTIAFTYNGAAQPDMVVTFNGTSTASWSFGGTTGTIIVYPS